MKNEKYCVALLISDYEGSTAICKKECTVDELDALKKDHEKDYISLIGWLPYEFYNGGDVSVDDKNFVNFY